MWGLLSPYGSVCEIVPVGLLSVRAPLATATPEDFPAAKSAVLIQRETDVPAVAAWALGMTSVVATARTDATASRHGGEAISPEYVTSEVLGLL